MRAVVATRPGPPNVLRVTELPDPQAGPDQVVVAVEVAAVVFVDTQSRAGTGPHQLDRSAFPRVPGNGVAGTVAQVGAGVDPAWIGTPVVTALGGHGGYATRAVASVADLHRIPGGLDPHTAAALLADGRTALGLVRAANVGRGDTVAVTAAAGGVGSLLVQLARRAGASVVALAGGPRKLAIAHDLGADFAVDYRAPGWTAQLDAAVGRRGGLDVVFDGVGGDVSAPLVDRLRAGGRYAPIGIASGRSGDVDERRLPERGITLVPLRSVGATAAELHRLVEDALHLAATGALRPVIGQTFPLEHAAEAHAAIERRETIGKTLLIVSPTRPDEVAATDPTARRRST